jgi:hypothetical protein
MSDTLVIEFAGWCMIRQPTDPDPYDERRGASGYTFAFADEPDLDRIIYFHPKSSIPLRSHGPAVGVWVTSATRISALGTETIEALTGAKVDLLGSPILENRNWTLTLPGFEPITPFNIAITNGTAAMASPFVSIGRQAPLDPDHPTLEAWQLSEAALNAKGATGMAYEPETVGRATGLWDFMQAAVDRRALLQRDLDALSGSNPTSPVVAQLTGRIAELTIGIDNPNDRRTGVRQIIERFGFDMLGAVATVVDPAGALHGELDMARDADWRIDFWMGAWDCDALCCFVQGALQIPYVTTPPAAARDVGIR